MALVDSQYSSGSASQRVMNAMFAAAAAVARPVSSSKQGASCAVVPAGGGSDDAEVVLGVDVAVSGVGSSGTVGLGVVGRGVVGCSVVGVGDVVVGSSTVDASTVVVGNRVVAGPHSPHHCRQCSLNFVILPMAFDSAHVSVVDSAHFPMKDIPTAAAPFFSPASSSRHVPGGAVVI